MHLASFRHKGLRRLYRDDDPKGLPGQITDKLRKILIVLETALDLSQVERFPGWRLHPLKGTLRGYWSLAVTGNWRLVFRYDEDTNKASDIDLIDYH